MRELDCLGPNRIRSDRISPKKSAKKRQNRSSPIRLSFFLSHLRLSSCIFDNLWLFYSIGSYGPIWNYIILFDFILSYSIFSDPVRSYSILFGLFDRHSSYSVLFNPIDSYSVLFDLIQSFSILSNPVFSYRVLFCLDLSRLIRFRPVLLYIYIYIKFFCLNNVKYRKI